MADAIHHDSSPVDYSTLEAVAPQPAHYTFGSDGLQASHLYGDDTLNGKEVAKAEGLEVTRDDDKEVSAPTDVERGEKENMGWKRRRMLGVPLWVVVGLVFLVVVGAAVGGAVGGPVRKGGKETTAIPAGPNEATNPATNIPPTNTSTPIGPSTAISTQSSSVPTQISTSKEPLEKTWYVMEQEFIFADNFILYRNLNGSLVSRVPKANLGLLRLNSTGNQSYVPDDFALWQFARAFNISTNQSLSHEGVPLFWITNKSVGEAFVLGDATVSMNPSGGSPMDMPQPVNIPNMVEASSKQLGGLWTVSTLFRDYGGQDVWHLWNKKESNYLGGNPNGGIPSWGLEIGDSSSWKLRRFGQPGG